jgi:hypothetical protein
MTRAELAITAMTASRSQPTLILAARRARKAPERLANIRVKCPIHAVLPVSAPWIGARSY